MQHARRHPSQRPAGPGQFESLNASELHCPKCRTLRPVRERLLLVLPAGELHAYRCVVCGETLGTRETKRPAGIVSR